MNNLESTILSQYANSPVILSLINSYNLALDQTTNKSSLISDIWDVSTCNDFGLSIWAKIVDINNFVYYPTTGLFFGFQTSDNVWQPFNSAPFSTGDALEYQLLPVDTETFRKMVIAKSMSNVSTATIPNINKILRYLFSSSGVVFITSANKMDIEVVLDFTPTALQKYILLYSNVIPRPAGVRVTLLTNTDKTTFGHNYDFSTTNTTFGNALL